MSASGTIQNALQSSSDWQRYQSAKLNGNDRMRVSGWSGSERTFDGYLFECCDFVAVDMRGIVFVHCRFCNCSFLGCVLNDVRFENVIIHDMRCSGVHGVGVVLRDADMQKMEVDKCRFESIDIQSCHISNSSSSELCVEHGLVDSVVMDVARIKYDEVRNVSMKGLHGISLELSEVKIVEVDLNDSTLHDCVFDGIDLSSFKAKSVDITETECIRPHLDSLSVESCRFSDGHIIGAELDKLCISSLGLHGTALVSCTWPEQDYRVGVLGGYHPAEHLLGQPVEDISGISPSLRETIRRAQRVDAMFNPAPGLPKALVLRIWGASSAYGRSIGRLTLTCLIFMVLASAAFLLGGVGDLSLCQLPLELLKSFESVFMTFLGVDADISGLSDCQEAILIATRLLGVVLFGIWIGVAATRFGEM